MHVSSLTWLDLYWRMASSWSKATHVSVAWERERDEIREYEFKVEEKFTLYTNDTTEIWCRCVCMDVYFGKVRVWMWVFVHVRLYVYFCISLICLCVFVYACVNARECASALERLCKRNAEGILFKRMVFKEQGLSKGDSTEGSRVWTVFVQSSLPLKKKKRNSWSAFTEFSWRRRGY